jgi:hypothetical protein
MLAHAMRLDSDATTQESFKLKTPDLFVSHNGRWLMSDSAVTFVRQLSGLSPALTALLGEHMQNNFGELLPHDFLGDVTLYLLSLVRAPGFDNALVVRRELRTVLDRLEQSYSADDEEVRELIGASFLENLPAKEEEGSEIREMIGSKLSAQLREMTCCRCCKKNINKGSGMFFWKEQPASRFMHPTSLSQKAKRGHVSRFTFHDRDALLFVQCLWGTVKGSGVFV